MSSSPENSPSGKSSARARPLPRDEAHQVHQPIRSETRLPPAPREVNPNEFSRPFIQAHLWARVASSQVKKLEALLSLCERLAAVVERMHTLAGDSAWLAFYSLQGEEDLPTGYFELSRIKQGVFAQIVLKEVRGAEISFEEEFFAPEFKSDEQEEAPGAFSTKSEEVEDPLETLLTKVDSVSGRNFYTKRSGEEVVLGFTVEGTQSNGAWNSSNSAFALTDGVLQALLIELPEGRVTIGFPNLDAFAEAFALAPEANPSLPLTAKDLQLILGAGGQLLEWAEDITSRESS